MNKLKSLDIFCMSEHPKRISSYEVTASQIHDTHIVVGSKVIFYIFEKIKFFNNKQKFTLNPNCSIFLFFNIFSQDLYVFMIRSETLISEEFCSGGSAGDTGDRYLPVNRLGCVYYNIFILWGGELNFAKIPPRLTKIARVTIGGNYPPPEQNSSEISVSDLIMKMCESWLKILENKKIEQFRFRVFFY